MSNQRDVTQAALRILAERDDKHFALVQKHIDKLEQQMKDLLLAQAEMEAYDWDRLDDLTYSFDGRRKMEAIRRGGA